jgi:UDP-N-acetylglucosamine/UDP-N-acetylgalactosamine diphosphorylase
MATDNAEHGLREKLRLYQQEHILACLDLMPAAEQRALLEDVRGIDFEKLAALYQSYLKSLSRDAGEKVFDTAEILAPPFNKTLYCLGEDYLREGKVGIFLVAGGQGTRLGFKGPKGCFPVSPVKRKTLFQLFAESIRALAVRYGRRLCWYIMTSRENDARTRNFFKDNQYFGLSPDHVRFLVQAEIPSLDRAGKLLMGRDRLVFKNPDGHGGALTAMNASGALQDMQEKGIEELFYFQVDNPLARIADPLFIGAHVEHRAEMSTKVVEKNDPAERVGIIGKINGRMGCIEYSELTPAETAEKKADGTLRFNSANTAIHMLKRSYIEKLTRDQGFALPYHIAVKDIDCLAAQGGALVPVTGTGIKFEMFIFDALAFAQNPVTMLVRREEEFSPVKNSDGGDSPQTAQQAMIRLFTRWLKSSAKAPPCPDSLVLEVSPLYALDEAEFLEKFTPPPSLSSPLYLGP